MWEDMTRLLPTSLIWFYPQSSPTFLMISWKSGSSLWKRLSPLNLFIIQLQMWRNSSDFSLKTISFPLLYPPKKFFEGHMYITVAVSLKNTVPTIYLPWRYGRDIIILLLLLWTLFWNKEPSHTMSRTWVNITLKACAVHSSTCISHLLLS